MDRYPGLAPSLHEDGSTFLVGPILIDAHNDNFRACGTYSIRIEIPRDYPYRCPSIYETSGLIPPEFDHRFEDGRLCLGTEIEQMLWLASNPSLVDFIEHFVLNYFFAVSFFRRFGSFPFGVRSHGVLGIVESYMDYFATDDIYVVARLVRAAQAPVYNGHHRCPCGSGRITRECHGDKIKRLRRRDVKAFFICDAELIAQSIAYAEGQAKLKATTRSLIEKQRVYKSAL